jgi:hypothetical protein
MSASMLARILSLTSSGIGWFNGFAAASMTANCLRNRLQDRHEIKCARNAVRSTRESVRSNPSDMIRAASSHGSVRIFHTAFIA